MGLTTIGAAARRGGKGPRDVGLAAGAAAGEPEAVSHNVCEEYSTVLYIIFIYIYIYIFIHIYKDQLKNKKPTSCHLLFLFYFLDTQHVSAINTPIIRNLRLCC